MFLSFILLMWCVTLTDFHMLPFLHPRNKSHLLMVYDPFNVLLDLLVFCCALLYLYSSGILAYNCLKSLSGFGIRVMLSL